MDKEQYILNVQDLVVKIADKVILDHFNLNVKRGEIHVIMGPNGSGKSTFTLCLAGQHGYDISGKVTYNGKDLMQMSVEDRARDGLFLSFQHPVEIPGVNNIYFLRSACNTIRRSRGEEEIDAMEFLDLARIQAKKLHMPDSFFSRSVNDGFSGGEKKKNEIFQILMLSPNLILLDEVDSGLDVDALNLISNIIQQLRNENRTIIIITHYMRLLEHISPNCVHILKHGRIQASGDISLARKIEESGFSKW